MWTHVDETAQCVSGSTLIAVSSTIMQIIISVFSETVKNV